MSARRSLFLLPAALALSAAGAAPGPATPPAVVTLAPMTAAIVDAGIVQGRLEVSLAVSGSDPARLEEHLPLVRAAAFEALSDHARLHASPFSAVQAGLLAAQLDRSVGRALPGSRVLLLKAAARPA